MKDDVNTKARLLFAAVLAVSIAAAVAWYYLSTARYATYELRTQEPVSGLIAEAPVEFHGVEVGKVRNIRLIDPRSVGILLSIERGTPVSSATVATITSRGLATRGFTGYVYVALEDGGTDTRPLRARAGERYPVIPATPSRVITLDTAITEAGRNVQIIATLVQTLLDDKTVVSLKQSADSLQKVSEVLAENTRKLDAIVANTERASHRFGPLMESSQETVRTLQMQILPELHKTLSTLDQLSGTAAKINRDPSILIRGAAPPPPGPGEGKAR